MAGERHLDRKKRELFRLLHPDKSSRFADQLGHRGVEGVERIRQAYNLVDEAYAKAKETLNSTTV